MPISPTVQQYQQDDSLENNNTSDAESLFKQKFGEAAYKVVQSKFAPILQYIVTFKIIEVDVDNGMGIGAFIIQKGKDLVYLPVVLAEGAIESCEMFYDKITDTFVPTSKKEIDKLLATNKLGNFELTKKVPKDMTTQTFRNMFRPPVSSRPMTMASDSSLSNLPNNAKEALSTYLTNNPTVLGKIAEFYPIESLATKLASVIEKEANIVEDLVDIIDINSLTKEAAQALSAEDKDDLLGDGFLFKTEPKSTPHVYVKKDLPVEVVTSLNLTEVQLNKDYKSITGPSPSISHDKIFCKGTIFCTGGTYLTNKTGILTRDNFYNTDGTYENIDSDTIVMSSFDTNITSNDLYNIGAKSISDFSISEDTSGSLHIFFKKKNNEYAKYCHNIHISYTKNYDDELVYPIRDVDGTITINGDCSRQTVIFTPEITYGCIKNNDSTIFPKDGTLVYFTSGISSSKEKPIAKISELINLFNRLGRSLRLVGDNITTTLRDSAIKKEASFNNKLDLVTYLYKNYSFNKEATLKLLNSREVITFDKIADNTDPYIAHMANAAGVGLTPSPAEVNIDGSMIQDVAAMGDQDLLDTGLIASVANTQDIKSYLLDMLPTFIKTTTDLGKAILLYVVKSKELKEYYSREEYSTFLSSLRRIFTNLGDLTTDLRAYTNNS